MRIDDFFHWHDRQQEPKDLQRLDWFMVVILAIILSLGVAGIVFGR